MKYLVSFIVWMAVCFLGLFIFTNAQEASQISTFARGFLTVTVAWVLCDLVEDAFDRAKDKGEG